MCRKGELGWRVRGQGEGKLQDSILDFVLQLLTNKGVSGGNSHACSLERREGSKDLLSVSFCRLPFLYRDV